MFADFTKTIRFGTMNISGKPRDVYCKINHNKGRLSVSGVVGPCKGGDCHGSCGQILMDFKDYDHRGWANLEDVDLAPDWTPEMLKQFLDTWDRWHLNDVQAGSPAQMQWLREHKQPITDEMKLNGNDYFKAAIHVLKGAGLQPDMACLPDGTPRSPEMPAEGSNVGYRYGNRWLSEEVPEDVLEWLRELPDADKTPAWC